MAYSYSLPSSRRSSYRRSSSFASDDYLFDYSRRPSVQYRHVEERRPRSRCNNRAQDLSWRDLPFLEARPTYSRRRSSLAPMPQYFGRPYGYSRIEERRPRHVDRPDYIYHSPPRRRSSNIHIPIPPSPKPRRIKGEKHLYFTRPSASSRNGKHKNLNTFLDTLTGRGADVFVTSTRHPGRLLRDRPQSWHWQGREPTRREVLCRLADPEFEVGELEGVRGGVPWVGRRRL